MDSYIISVTVFNLFSRINQHSDTDTPTDVHFNYLAVLDSLCSVYRLTDALALNASYEHSEPHTIANTHNDSERHHSPNALGNCHGESHFYSLFHNDP